MGCLPQNSQNSKLETRNSKLRRVGVFAGGLFGYSPTSNSRRTAYDAVVNAPLTTDPGQHSAVKVSIGIIAWNEERAIGPMLNSLFQQSLFAEFHQRGLQCEIICVANGCTDRTTAVAAGIFTEQERRHSHATAISWRVMNLEERGKINAWNRFVHSFSARDAQFLFLMDADILIHRPHTLWNMVRALENNSEATVAVDQPCKDISFRARKSPFARLSLAASGMTGAAAGQLCGQIYCIRADIARNIYLPKDLGACEDGFIKTLVCTDFLMHPVWPWRMVAAEDAAHTFEAYVSPRGIFKNQKRQMIGQTIVHILVDEYLPKLPAPQRARLADTLREKERTDPDWLKHLINEHLRRTRFFWRLYPGLLGHHFQRLARLNPVKRLICLPAAISGFCVALVSSFFARESLKAGSTRYWPRAERAGLAPLEDLSQPRAS